ncbi:MAG: hypothetical protein M1820_009128 [Bogoriella megaspora]|nr:MAG: hypothetical protein M1820_009128 [Bogoriella megaspora]
MARFLDLPLEIRFMIYELVFNEHRAVNGICLDDAHPQRYRNQRSLLLVCKLITPEATEVLYRRINFRIVVHPNQNTLIISLEDHDWAQHGYVSHSLINHYSNQITKVTRLTICMDEDTFGNLCGDGLKSYDLGMIKCLPMLKQLRVAVFSYFFSSSSKPELAESYKRQFYKYFGRARVLRGVKEVLASVPKGCVVNWGLSEDESFSYTFLPRAVFIENEALVLGGTEPLCSETKIRGTIEL